MPTCDASIAGGAETDFLREPMVGTDPSISFTKHAIALVFCELGTVFSLTEFWLVPRRLIITFARLAGKMEFPWVFPPCIRSPMFRPSPFTIRAEDGFLNPFVLFSFVSLIFVSFFVVHAFTSFSHPLSFGVGGFLPNGNPQILWNQVA